MKLWMTSILCLYMRVNSQQLESGFSDQYRSENTLGDYAFGYNVDHTTGGSFRRESGDRYGNKVGSYGLRIADGRIRVVNYIADNDGYRAKVVSNEPGLSQQESNRFLEIAKKRFQSVFVPGFVSSSRAPHVTFQSHLSKNVQYEDQLGQDHEDFANQNFLQDSNEEFLHQPLDLNENVKHN